MEAAEPGAVPNITLRQGSRKVAMSLLMGADPTACLTTPISALERATGMAVLLENKMQLLALLFLAE